jgi:hypothetical protein
VYYTLVHLYQTSSLLFVLSILGQLGNTACHLPKLGNLEAAAEMEVANIGMLDVCAFLPRRI